MGFRGQNRGDRGQNRGDRGQDRGEQRNRPQRMPGPMANLFDTFPIEDVRSHEDGSFSFTNIPVGEYFLEANVEGYCPFASDTIEIEEGTIVEDVQILCVRGGIIKGLVTDIHGTPLNDRTVIISNPDFNIPERVLDIAFHIDRFYLISFGQVLRKRYGKPYYILRLFDECHFLAAGYR